MNIYNLEKEVLEVYVIEKKKKSSVFIGFLMVCSLKLKRNFVFLNCRVFWRSFIWFLFFLVYFCFYFFRINFLKIYYLYFKLFYYVVEEIEFILVCF